MVMMIVETADEGNHVIATLRNLRLLLLLFRSANSRSATDTAH